MIILVKPSYHYYYELCLVQRSKEAVLIYFLFRLKAFKYFVVGIGTLVNDGRQCDVWCLVQLV